MIETLSIENIAIVERVEIEFGPGLNVITGETGTGKSIVLGALSLLVGARVPAGSLREGADRGSVEALFDTSELPELEKALAERGLAGDDDDAHALVVRRQISSGGRSRARIGGQMVPIATMGDLFAGRIEISSQHSSQALLRPESHGRFLDAAGGLLPQRARVREAFERLRAVDEEIQTLREAAEERAREQDYLAFQLAELDEVDLAPGELDALASEHGRLAHAERLQADGAVAVAALQGDERASERSASDLLDLALRQVDDMARVDGTAEPLATRLRSAHAELQDIAADLERYVSGIEGDPARLAQLEERIGQVEKLRRKYGQTEAEILAHRDRIAEQLAGIESADARIDALARERAAAAEALRESAAALSAGREKAARRLSKDVERSLADLAMPDARFVVSMEPPANRNLWPAGAESGPAGAEAPLFEFSANRGQSPRSLQKVASGGELSRIFLAVKNALRGVGGSMVMVLIFDEVDTGMGGRAAERVGRVLAELASAHQVICITHLPQIAAFGDHHFRVQKRVRGSGKRARTEVLVGRVEGEERVDEIARMAGGEEISDATRRHARALLQVGPEG